MDKITRMARSRNMSQIKSKNTKPEMLLRSALYKKGYRYRIHSIKLPGKPDIILSKYKLAIFVNGCFWHGHNCIDGHVPKTRIKYWKNKIEANASRDGDKIAQLELLGWKTITIWECNVEKDLNSQIKKIEKELSA